MACSSTGLRLAHQGDRENREPCERKLGAPIRIDARVTIDVQVTALTGRRNFRHCAASKKVPARTTLDLPISL